MMTVLAVLGGIFLLVTWLLQSGYHKEEAARWSKDAELARRFRTLSKQEQADALEHLQQLQSRGSISPEGERFLRLNRP